MERRIIEALEKSFIGAKVELDPLTGERYSGVIIWDGFQDADAVDRQDQIWEALRLSLKSDATRVGVLLAYTPREIGAMQAA